jgi:hypothetical protein
VRRATAIDSAEKFGKRNIRASVQPVILMAVDFRDGAINGLPNGNTVVLSGNEAGSGSRNAKWYIWGIVR